MSQKKKSGKQVIEKQVALMADSFDFCFWSYNCKQKKITAAAAICELIPNFNLQKEAGESPNPIVRFIHPDDRPQVDEAFKNIVVRESTEKVGCRVVLPDNRRYFVILHLKSRRNPRGEIEFVDCILNHFPGRDIKDKSVLTSENVFLQMAEFSPDIIFVHSMGRVVYINKTGMRLLKGNSADDFLGRDVRDLIHPDYANKIKERIRKVRELKEPMPFMKEKILCLDGTAIDVEVSSSPLIFMGEDAIQVVGRDITQMRRIDRIRNANFKISEAVHTTTDLGDMLGKIHGILGEVINAANFCVALYDKKNDRYSIPYCANDYEGCSYDDIIQQKNPVDYVRRTGKPLLADRMMYRELVAKGIISVSKHEPLVWLGLPITINEQFTGVISMQSYDDAGCCTPEDLEILTVISDKIALAIGRKNSEKALQLNERLLRQVIDLIPFMVFAKDREGRYVFCNQVGAEMLGTTPREIVGKTIKEIIPWRPEYEQYLLEEKEVIETGQAKIIPDDMLVYINGVAHYLQVSMYPVNLSGYDDICLLAIAIDMTKHKEAEKQLRNSENLYRTTLDAMGDYIHVVDRELNVTLANEAFIDWLQQLAIDKAPVGKNIRVLFPFLEDKVYAEYEEVFTKGKLLLTEEINEVDGRIIYTETRKKPIFDGDKVKLVMTVIRDTTREKEEHRALVENEARLKLTLESTSDGLWEWWVRTGKGYFSSRFYTMLGYEPDEFEPNHENWVNLIHPDDRESALALVTEIIQKKVNTFHIEFRLRTKDGGWKWIYSRGKFVEWDEDGAPVRMVGTHIDITELKETEKALKERESLISSVFRAAPTGIGMVINRVIMKVNDRFCEMLGYSSEELTGKSARILYESDEEFERIGRDKYARIAREGIGTVETRFVRKDGRVIDILLSSTPIDPNNLSVGVTFTALNITESKLAEKALHSALRKMEEDQHSLTEKNVALREVLNQIENEKRQIQLQIQANVDKILLPMIANIQNRIGTEEIQYFEVLKNTLMDITSPFVNKLNSLYSKLTPREIEICNMIKSGMTSKEIALTLKISVETVHKTRYNIRRKFGILNEEINLTSFLKTI
ncbi:MAG: PAS domain S-box protein [Candidatus Zixiibacteriota bacterium]